MRALDRFRGHGCTPLQSARGKSAAPAYRAGTGLGTRLEQIFRGTGSSLSLECAHQLRKQGCVLKKWMLALPAAGLAAAVAPAVYAHFELVEPASWLEQDDRGDPQRLAPCGGTLADPGEPTAAVTAVTGGSKLKIVV